jgi:hypothetical protein
MENFKWYETSIIEAKIRKELNNGQQPRNHMSGSELNMFLDATKCVLPVWSSLLNPDAKSWTPWKMNPNAEIWMPASKRLELKMIDESDRKKEEDVESNSREVKRSLDINRYEILVKNKVKRKQLTETEEFGGMRKYWMVKKTREIIWNRSKACPVMSTKQRACEKQNMKSILRRSENRSRQLIKQQKCNEQTMELKVKLKLIDVKDCESKKMPKTKRRPKVKKGRQWRKNNIYQVELDDGKKLKSTESKYMQQKYGQLCNEVYIFPREGVG